MKLASLQVSLVPFGCLIAHWGVSSLLLVWWIIQILPQSSLLFRCRDADELRQQADQPIQQPSLPQSGHFPSSDINRRGIPDAAAVWFSRLQICLEQRLSVRPRFVLQILVFQRTQAVAAGNLAACQATQPKPARRLWRSPYSGSGCVSCWI